MEEELNGLQLERQDCVDDVCFNVISELALGHEIEWDIELISIVREAVQEVIVDRLGLMTEMEFYPYIELTDG